MLEASPASIGGSGGGDISLLSPSLSLCNPQVSAGREVGVELTLTFEPVPRLLGVEGGLTTSQLGERCLKELNLFSNAACLSANALSATGCTCPSTK